MKPMGPSFWNNNHDSTLTVLFETNSKYHILLVLFQYESVKILGMNKLEPQYENPTQWCGVLVDFKTSSLGEQKNLDL